jgi:hypothetical protein
VFILKVSVNISFVGIGIFLKFKLGNILFSISFSLTEELTTFFDLVVGGSKVNVTVVKLSLEIGILKGKLVTSLFEFFLGFLFRGS